MLLLIAVVLSMIGKGILLDGDVRASRVLTAKAARISHSAERRAIWSAVDREIRTWEYSRSLGPYYSRYTFGFCYVDEEWAFASIMPRRFPDKVLPDGVGVLLRKRSGRWKLMRMGTDSF